MCCYYGRVCQWNVSINCDLKLPIYIVNVVFPFSNFSGNKIVSILLTIVVIGVNLYFVVAQVEQLNIEGGLLAVVCK